MSWLGSSLTEMQNTTFFKDRAEQKTICSATTKIAKYIHLQSEIVEDNVCTHKNRDIKRGLLPPSPDPEPASEERTERNLYSCAPVCAGSMQSKASVKCTTVHLAFDGIPG